METHACNLGTREAKAEDCLELETRLDKQQEHQKKPKTPKKGGGGGGGGGRDGGHDQT